MRNENGIFLQRRINIHIMSSQLFGHQQSMPILLISPRPLLHKIFYLWKKNKKKHIYEYWKWLWLSTLIWCFKDYLTLEKVIMQVKVTTICGNMNSRPHGLLRASMYE